MPWSNRSDSLQSPQAGDLFIRRAFCILGTDSRAGLHSCAQFHVKCFSRVRKTGVPYFHGSKFKLK